MAVVGAAPCQCFSPGENQTRVARPNSLDRAAPALCPTTPSCEDESLAERMRVPCSSRAGLKRYAGVLNRCRIGCLKKRIDPHGASEPLCRPLPEGCELTLLISISCIPSLHGRYSLRFERSHVDGKAVLHIGLEQSIVGFVDLLDRDDFDLGGDVVLPAEIEHLLSFGDAADARA
jgi:hypothetical protein